MAESINTAAGDLPSSSHTHSDVLSSFDYVLCSKKEELDEALKLRLDVFHKEQGFPADTEIDEYDPISAHFILVRRQEKAVVATVRLTPYPRKPWLDTKKSPLPSPGLTQNETSLVTSGGGPQGTAGGLPMFSSTDEEQPGTKSRGAPAEAADDEAVRSEYPLGQALSAAELAQRFQKTFHSTEPIDEEEGAPQVRGAKVSRLAVSRSARGLGLGALMMRQAEGWLLGLEMHTGSTKNKPAAQIDVVISSQMQAKGFYDRLGYVVFGKPYDEEGAPHCWCVKRLSE